MKPYSIHSALSNDDPSSSGGSLCLTDVDILSLDEDTLDTNFTDQDARLVCLVCYKIFPPGQHEQYRTDVSGHPRAALAKIHIQKPLPFKCAACLSAFATEKLLREHELVRVFHSV